MPYLGNNLQVAYQSYRVIDDISSGFNGSTTSFALKVGGYTPAPFPINPQQCVIIVGGVPQKPDITGGEGFTFSGSNIVFSSAPAAGEKFWGVILAGADYVAAGVTYPNGTAATPSITFGSNTSTGLYLSSTNVLGIATGGVNAITVDSSQRVGINNATPVVSLDVVGGIKGTITSGTAQSSTSGTAIDFTNIPSWVKRVTVMFDGVSTNGGSIPLVQIGAGSVATSGYTSSQGYILSSATAVTNTSTAGFLIGGTSATDARIGNLFIVNYTGNKWVASGTHICSAGVLALSAGSVSLSGTLDRIRITTVNGTDTLDAGSINILYEG